MTWIEDYDDERPGPTDDERCEAMGHPPYGEQDGFIRCMCGAWYEPHPLRASR